MTHPGQVQIGDSVKTSNCYILLVMYSWLSYMNIFYQIQNVL